MIPIYIIIAILFFGLLILIHESGHYFAARLCKVGIKEFAVGMGPRILSRKSKKNDTVYSLRLFPIGGFISMVGEDEQIDKENSFALCNKTKLQRLFVISAGALTNIIIGVLAMMIFVSFRPMYLGTTISDTHDSVLAEYGIQSGDKIIKMDSQNVHVFDDISNKIMLSKSKPMDIVIERNGKKIVIENVVFKTQKESGIDLGVIDFKVNAVKRNFLEIIKQTFYQSFATIRLIWDSFVMLISGEYGLDAVSGPVGTVGVVAEAASYGPLMLLYFFTFISMNLGVFNLLPFPALDGGRLLFLAIEAIFRKPVSPKIEGAIHFAGFMILIAFVIFITFKDIIKLF